MEKQPELVELAATFEQPQDCCQSGNDWQSIKLRVENGGEGTDEYFVISTVRWAFDDAAELAALVDRFAAMIQAARKEAKG